MKLLIHNIQDTKDKDSLVKKIPDAKTLIQVNQYNTDKQNFEKKKTEMLIKNSRYEWFIDFDSFKYKNE